MQNTECAMQQQERNDVLLGDQFCDWFPTRSNQKKLVLSLIVGVECTVGGGCLAAAFALLA